MITASLLVDLGGPAKLAPDDHGNIVIQTPGVDVLDQRRDTLVKQRQVLTKVSKIAAGRIPETVPERDTSHPGFNQPPGDQKLIVLNGRAISQVAR